MNDRLQSTQVLLILTCALSRTPRKVYVVHDHITAMTTDAHGTTLYLTGGKHMQVKEHPADIWRGLSSMSVRAAGLERATENDRSALTR